MRMIISTDRKPVRRHPRRALRHCALLAGLGGLLAAAAGHADTVASLLGNFTINQFEALTIAGRRVEVHYVVVYGQLPALRELHLADANGDGITSETERDAYVGGLAPGLADGLTLSVDGARVPLRATRWHSSLPTEQGGFSLRVDMDFSAALPAGAPAPHALQFDNQNFPGRIGWHEIVVTGAEGVAVFDTNAFATSATNALTDALQTLPADGPLDERSVHFRVAGQLPAGAEAIGARPGTSLPSIAPRGAADYESTWISAKTRRLVDAISAPQLAPGVMLGTLLAALLLGAVHALSPGHGKTIVGAYLIGSRGTPRHAAFLGFTVTVTHTLGVFAVGFATLYASRFIVPERLFPILSLISALMVLGMGLVLLVQRARAAKATSGSPAWDAQPEFTAIPMPRGAGPLHTPLLAHHHGDGTLHSHGGGPLHSHLPPGARGEQVTWRSLLTLGISGGLVPCPSAMVLLLAAIALNKTAYGMLLVLVFSVGLAITLTLVGLAFLYARNRFGSGDGERWWTRWLPVVSALMITLVGGALCVAAVRSFA